MSETRWVHRAEEFPQGQVADFRVEVFADEANEGFRMFRVRLTGSLTGITAEETSPVPEWALLRCWRKLAKELKTRADNGEAPASIGAALVAAEAQRPRE